MSETPRTNAEQDDARNVALEFTCRNPPPKEGENCYVVSADFARQLERELNIASEQIKNLRKGQIEYLEKIRELVNATSK